MDAQAIGLGAAPISNPSPRTRTHRALHTVRVKGTVYSVHLPSITGALPVHCTRGVHCAWWWCTGRAGSKWWETSFHHPCGLHPIRRKTDYFLPARVLIRFDSQDAKSDKLHKSKYVEDTAEIHLRDKVGHTCACVRACTCVRLCEVVVCMGVGGS